MVIHYWPYLSHQSGLYGVVLLFVFLVCTEKAVPMACRLCPGSFDNVTPKRYSPLARTGGHCRPIKKEEGSGTVHWKDVFFWCIKSLIPILLSVAFLLYYNHLRFGDFLDFGYVTINGSEWTLSRVQEYGMFHPQFIPFNFHWMFFGIPQIVECKFYLTRGLGISIFLASPALLYLFRRFKFTWWIVGCWSSIILSTLLLLMYHNNGSNQYSYRYWMDFVVPVMMLLAYTAGRRISLPLKVLIIASILVNYYGIVSWYRGPC